jgi:hypothetical protein
MQCTLNGSTVTMMAESFSLDDRIGQRSECSFTVLDSAGTASYKQGMPVSILADDGSTLFAGYVWTSRAKRETWTGLKAHRVSCVDGVYLADKRKGIKTYTNILAGDAVSDLVQTYLEPEGVIGRHVTRTETLQGDWALDNSGSLSANLSSSASPGDLVLSQAGSNVSRTETSTADFAAGTLTNVTAGSTGGGDLEISKGSNYLQTDTAQADFASGTLTNVTAESGGDLALTGYWRDWADNTTTGQTGFGTNGTHSSSGGAYTIGVTVAGGEYHVRFDNAGTYADFTLEVDLTCPSAGDSVGIVYRTTNWANADYTFAYVAFIKTNQVAINRGANSGTTAGSPVTVATSAPTLTAGTVYRCKLIVSGSSHTFIVGGTTYISAATDATFTAAGNVGLRYNSGAGAAHTTTVDNFGVVKSLSGTSIKDYDISASLSAASSSVSWTSVLNSQSITVEAALSTNGGGSFGSYNTCTSGSAIPGISTTTDLSNARLRIRITLTATDATKYFHLDDITLSITAGYRVSGTRQRVWSSLSLAAAVTVGSAIISWNATVPASTTLVVETSINAGSSYQTATSGAAISGLASGTSVAGVSLLVRVTLTTTDATATPMLSDLTVTVVSQYASSGVRTSPSLSLAPAGTARAATVSWTQTLNGGTILIETSVDGGATWATATNGGSIAGLNLITSSDYTDGYDADTSAQYSTQTGGGFTWAWDTSNSRLLATCGSSVAQRARYTGGTYQDVWLTAESDQADSAGLIARSAADYSSFYALYWRDSSGDTGWITGGIELWKRVSGTYTFLARYTPAAVRGSSHRYGLRISGTSIQAYLDGVQVLSVTDSSVSAAGYVGYECGNGSGQVQHIGGLTVNAMGTDLTGKSLLIRETLTAPAGRAATPVLSDLSVSVKTYQIADGPTIAQVQVGYVSISSALGALAEASNTWWNIDSSKRIWFLGSTVVSAPWQVTSADMHDEDATELEEGNPLYRNRQYLVNVKEVTSLQTESQKGDGSSRAFTVAYPVHQAPASITVNGVSKTVGIKQVDTGKDFYWAKGDTVIAQDSGGTLLTSSDTWQIQYYGEWDAVYLAQDSGGVATQAALEGGTTGYVEDVDSVAGIAGDSALAQIANGKLARFCQYGRRLTFKTTKAGLRSGQLATVTLPEHSLAGAQMLIEHVAAQEVGIRLWYTVTAVIGPIDSSWVQFFQQLAGAVEGGIDTVSIGTSGTLVINQAVSESITWGESVTETILTVTYPGAAVYPDPALYPA